MLHEDYRRQLLNYIDKEVREIEKEKNTPMLERTDYAYLSGKVAALEHLRLKLNQEIERENAALDAEWEENGEYFTGEYKPHKVFDIFTIIIWKDQKEIDRFETAVKERAINWIKEKGYRDMEVAVEIQVNGEMLDPITEEELGF